jgi:hypothetical protein
MCRVLLAHVACFRSTRCGRLHCVPECVALEGACKSCVLQDEAVCACTNTLAVCVSMSAATRPVCVCPGSPSSGSAPHLRVG